MTDSQLWMIVPGNAGLSALILFVIAMPFLYAARAPAHNLVRAVGHLASGPLRLVSRWLLAAALLAPQPEGAEVELFNRDRNPLEEAA